MSRSVRRKSSTVVRCAFVVATACLAGSLVSISLQAAQDSETPPTSLEKALPADATGERIFRQTCATCHAVDGTGSPQSVLGFQMPLPNGHTLPDFNDCPTNTVEPLGDWVAVATRGGPIRGLDRHMPSFGDALSPEQIEKVVRYLWTFCSNPKWPRGDLNFPRAFFTEKAFPESETVWTTGITARGSKRVGNDLTYEHRVGIRGQYEVTIPIDFQQGGIGGSWSRGLGDLELAYRQTLFASEPLGSIFAAGGAVTLTTGKEDRGLGNGFTVYEPFAMFDQAIGASSFVQLHGGYEIASDRTKGENEAYLRSAFGYTVAQDKGFGRAWTPMAEVLLAKPEHGVTEWDVVPQMQVSLSKLQHILVSVGVRVPLNERDERKPELLTYFLWDWFDGGLFEFWK
jgi:mono/diheme cytochrome c family protein